MPINPDRKSVAETFTNAPKSVPAPEQKPTVEFKPTDPIYGIEEIILSKETAEEIKTVINSKKNWEKVFVEWDLRSVLKQRKSLFVNLYGAPGTGKTMAAHAIAKETGQKIVCVNYADIESKYVGETSKNLVRLFEQAKKDSFVIFFDEADALLSKRVTNMSSSTDVSVNQTRSVLLTLLNDYDGMIIFATNFISNFDPAFMRRIQFHVKFELPNEEMRRRIWARYIPRQMPITANIDTLAKNHDGLSGSDISTAVLNAALKAANDNMNQVTQEYFEEAVKNIITSRNENSYGEDVTVTRKKISKEEAMRQLGGGVKFNEPQSTEQQETNGDKPVSLTKTDYDSGNVTAENNNETLSEPTDNVSDKNKEV
ncbi:MAG: ATP-binding protein [Prevotella sp.]|nr:ATP-binding protein [Prevotella sp.]